jgi:hypothetical protein
MRGSAAYGTSSMASTGALPYSVAPTGRAFSAALLDALVSSAAARDRLL